MKWSDIFMTKDYKPTPRTEWEKRRFKLEIRLHVVTRKQGIFPYRIFVHIRSYEWFHRFVHRFSTCLGKRKYGILLDSIGPGLLAMNRWNECTNIDQIGRPAWTCGYAQYELIWGCEEPQLVIHMDKSYHELR